VVGYAVNCF